MNTYFSNFTIFLQLLKMQIIKSLMKFTVSIWDEGPIEMEAVILVLIPEVVSNIISNKFSSM